MVWPTPAFRFAGVAAGIDYRPVTPVDAGLRALALKKTNKNTNKKKSNPVGFLPRSDTRSVPAILLWRIALTLPFAAPQFWIHGRGRASMPAFLSTISNRNALKRFALSGRKILLPHPAIGRVEIVACVVVLGHFTSVDAATQFLKILSSATAGDSEPTFRSA